MFLRIVQTVILLVSHPFRRKTLNEWGTEVYGKVVEAMDRQERLVTACRLPSLYKHGSLHSGEFKP